MVANRAGRYSYSICPRANSRKRGAEDEPENPATGGHGPSKRSRDLRHADSSPIRDGDLEDPESRSTAAPGQPIVLLGYPTGLDALLARLDESVADAVVKVAGGDPEKISQEPGAG